VASSDVVWEAAGGWESPKSLLAFLQTLLRGARQ